jgi:hypothetical protein
MRHKFLHYKFPSVFIDWTLKLLNTIFTRTKSSVNQGIGVLMEKALQSKHSEVHDLVGHHEERMRRVFAMINDTIFYT